MAGLLKKFGIGSSPQVSEGVAVDEIQSSGASSPKMGEKNEKDVGVSSSHELPEAEAARRLKAFKRNADALWDPNLESEVMHDVEEAVGHHDKDAENNLVHEMMDNSPYPEVRAAVRNYDVDLPCNTIRMWVISMLMTTIGSGLNMLFSLRSPSITITSYVAQLIVYPVGLGWDKVMPNREFNTFGVRWNLNPGPFNFKEHAMIVIMANASFGTGVGYFTDILQAQRGFYKFNWGWGFGVLVALSTQCVGFGLAGLFSRWLVEPAGMIWPQDLVNCAFMYTLHDNSKTDPAKTNGWSISRYRWFFYVFMGSFLYYWFPGYIAQFLSVFAFPTWIAPNNITVNKVFGGYSGMALLPITFDWTQITGYVFSPLIPPWHAIGNTLIGLVLFYWITASAVHFSGTWYADYLPFSDSSSYDNTASVYNVSKILTPEITLDLTKYKEYSPLFLSTTFALCYGLSFAAISAVVVHTILFHGKFIMDRWRRSRDDMRDVHQEMMDKYPKVPAWWFLSLLAVCIGLSFATIYAYPTEMSWWALILAFIISFVWFVPIGMVQAITNVQLGLNVFTEFLIGYMQPGKPNAMMLFKTYGYITMTQGLAFTQDMKLGHYLKVPPRTMFLGQLIATIWSCIVQLAVFEWAFGGGIKDLCALHQTNHFTCPGGRVFYNASVIWGVIGPARMFSGDSTYKNLQYFWLAGAAAPIIFYFAAKQWPKSPVRFLSAPLIFGGTGQIPPATPLNYLSWGIVGFIFNKFIRNRYRGWWMRFNYITSAALDSGLAISTILIVLTISLTNTDAPNWWGNVGVYNTMDYLGTAVAKVLPEGATFGPSTW
ncbi:small oligopeptide transporter [Aureobasidium subglaciale]|nr:small oligopeptide transporter [Aureobasidium subglaciale]KAI5226474.1 small oligopeptide transporter [Aureobasidium subglaciale]KAI5229839.1 small oligopeptide transporter [Aureobasidium subglaciale]KAI5264398.1 small oligopeptide transporter [Aureobasidium subglaciale]